MIVITDMKFYEVPGSVCEIKKKVYRTHHLDRSFININKTNMGIDVIDQNVIVQHLKGRRLCQSDGREVVVAFDHESAEILGWQNEAWESMEHEIKNQSREIDALLKKQRELKSANLLTRIKWIFTGVN